MSEQIKHECGVAMIRLLKPLEYYKAKYGTWMYGLNKLYLLMEKQHNRGQDGAGIVNVKIGMPPGQHYIHRYRSNADQPIKDVFDKVHRKFTKIGQSKPDLLQDPVWVKANLSFAGEVYLGHLRYGTFGNNKIETVHPVMRQNNWKTRTLALMGNFNLTNVEELFNRLVDLGQHPKGYSDTVTILENVGHFLDRENQELFDQFKKKGLSNRDISSHIAEDLDMAKVLASASKRWDGGYVIAGVTGNGDTFITRDPHGIRPAYYYQDEEVVVAASERPVIQTAMNLKTKDIRELMPGQALIVKQNGKVKAHQVRKPGKRKACSFERIYFSRGSDEDIYQERKKLGELLTPVILEKINGDIENTVFSYIPNTAETAFYGMMKGMRQRTLEIKKRKIRDLNEMFSEDDLHEIISFEPRVEKIAHKDVKLRTFISQDEGRSDLVGHVYDITYGTVRPGKDTLIILDDSIVRGTTLRESILKILDRLGPKKIIVVSSAPQIRYPDCYGIDMARLGDFCAFQAAIELLKESGQDNLINQCYNKCLEQLDMPMGEMSNKVKMIYEAFTAEQISEKIGQILKPGDINAEVEIVYNSIENLHEACPDNKGDWYFTGNYPTPGGVRVVNTAFVNYIRGDNKRAY